MANKIKNFWEYELYDSKEKKLSINETSKARYFAIYINNQFEGLFELPSKITNKLKKELIAKQSKKSLRLINKYKQEQLTKIPEGPRETVLTDTSKTLIEFELFNKNQEKISSNNLTKAKFFTIFVNNELQGYFELPDRISAKEKESLIGKQSKKVLKLFKKIEKNKIVEVPKVDLNRATKTYEERNDFHSPTYNRHVERYFNNTVFYKDIDIETNEKILVDFIDYKIDMAIERFIVDLKNKKFNKLRLFMSLKKTQDENYNEVISTSYVSTKKELKNAMYKMFTAFNKDKYLKERYGEIFKDETIAIEEFKIGVNWWEDSKT